MRSFALAVLALLLVLPAAHADGEGSGSAANPKLPTKPAVEPKRVSAAHIIVNHKGAKVEMPGVTRTKEEAKTRALEALAYARKADVTWADAVNKYTDLAESKRNAGALGVYERGKLPPAFKGIEDAMFSMEIGQISDLVESPYGYHIVTRLPVVEYAASHVLIQYTGASRSTSTRSKADALKLAQQVLKESRAEGASFAKIAQRYSEGPSGPSGGFLGVFGPGQMVPAFEAALGKAKLGEVTGPVETKFGYHVIKRHQFVRASHVLVMYAGAKRADGITRTKEEAKALADKVLAEAKAEGADFAALAKKHSDGPTSTKGGDLGAFIRGRMVPAFEKVAFGLKVGEVGFAETPFGFHVIKRTD